MTLLRTLSRLPVGSRRRRRGRRVRRTPEAVVLQPQALQSWSTNRKR